MKKLSYVLALTLLLAACGSDSESDKPEATAAPGSTTVESNTSTKEDAKSKEEDTSKKEDASKETDEKGKFYADAFNEEVPYLTENQGVLSQESYDYILNNVNLVPAVTDDAIAQVKSQAETIDLKLLNKSLTPYYSTLVTFEGYVIQVQEETYENGETAAWLNVYDEVNDTNHNVYMYKTTGDILEEDFVQFWGIPITTFSYETLDGGFQNTILYFGSHVEKK